MRKFQINLKLDYLVIFNHTLEDYTKYIEKISKKHSNLTTNLSKLTKIQVQEFDATNTPIPNEDTKNKAPKKSHNKLLAGKKWWLIDEVYYEVPRSWFGRLKTRNKLIIIGALTASLISGISLPLILGKKVGNNFDDYINFEDTRLVYDGSEHAVKFNLKEGKQLPTQTTINYYYQQQTKTGEQCFSFTDAGTYQVTLELKAPKFNIYNKTINYVIDKKELSDEQKNKIDFNGTQQVVGNVVSPTLVNESGIYPISSTDFEYKVNGNWTKDLPTAIGTYDVRKTLIFQNYNDFTLSKPFYVNKENTIRITFNVAASGGTWGEGTSDNESITTDPIQMDNENKITFSACIANLKLKKASDPAKIGYSFANKWTNDGTPCDSTTIFKYNEGDSTIFKALFNINKYKITFDKNGGSSVSTPSVEIDYNEPVLEKIKGFSAPIHSSGKFKGWGLSADSKESISSSYKMPASDKTLYALWYKYDFKFIDNEDYVTVGGTTSFDNLISLNKTQFNQVTFNAKAGYEFNNKFDVYFGAYELPVITDFTFTDYNEIAPGQYDITEDTGKNYEIKIKPKFEGAKIKAAIDPDGGEVKKGDDPITTLDIKCGDQILTYLNGLTVTKDHTVFENKWTLIDGTTAKEITAETIMPANAVTIKPIYHTYTINVVGDGNVTIDNSTTTFTNRIGLYSDEIKYTVNNGYIFKEFEYSLNGTDYESLEYGMPYMPYDYDISSETLNDTVYLKVTTEPISDTMEVYIDAGEGELVDYGTNYKIVTFNKGKTLRDILNTVGAVQKGGTDPNHWVDANNQTINLDAAISGVNSYYARAVYAGE